MKKILFITHETSRTGAPMVLLHFLRWIKTNHPEILTDVLALRGGDLEAEFKGSSHTYYNYDELTKNKPLRFLQKVFLKFRLLKKSNKNEELIKNLFKKDYNLVFANTIISIPFAHRLTSIHNKIRLVVHMHELDTIIKLVLPNFKNYINSIDQFIAPSKLVKTNLVNNWSIPDNKIEVVYECATIDKSNKKLSDNKKKHIFTVGASGTAHWRKGHDIFLHVARYINTNYPDAKIKFVWVGRIPLEEKVILEEDLKKLGLNGIVLFTDEVKDASNYFNDFDVFALTSREDPFPLVCIEVGLLGKPIICFKDATGTEEIIEKGGGYIVPYLSIEAMAEKVIYYHKNTQVKEAHGEINKKEFSKFLPQEICPQLFSVIQNVIIN